MMDASMTPPVRQPDDYERSSQSISLTARCSQMTPIASLTPTEYGAIAERRGVGFWAGLVEGS